MPINDNDTWWLVPVNSTADAEVFISRMPLALQAQVDLLGITTRHARVTANTDERIMQARNFARRAGHLGASPQPRTSLDGKQAWLHGPSMAKPTTDALGPFTLAECKQHMIDNPRKWKDST
jgi:hypothetical protein